MSLDPVHEARIEQWLVRRGIPHFIAQYSASRDVLTRAIPFLTLVFLVEMIGAGSLDWPWWANRLAEVGGLAVLVGLWAVVNRARGRRLLARPESVGWVEVAVFVAGPALLPVLFGGSLEDAGLTVALNVAILASAYVVTSYGILPMSRWALLRVLAQVGETLRLFTRGLPLLLVAFTFLFINAEVWQVAASLDVLFLGLALGLFAVVGIIFVVSRLPDEVRPLDVFVDAAEISALLEATPAAGLSAPDPHVVPPPSVRGWVNAGLVMLFVQGLRIVAAALLIGAFFVAFGLLTMRPETIEAWTASPVDVVGSFDIAGRTIILTEQLLAVAAFLAGFSGMYFAVSVVTDSTLRSEFFDDVRHDVRQAFAVRAVYVTHSRGDGDSATPSIG